MSAGLGTYKYIYHWHSTFCVWLVLEVACMECVGWYILGSAWMECVGWYTYCIIHNLFVLIFLTEQTVNIIQIRIKGEGISSCSHVCPLVRIYRARFAGRKIGLFL